MKASIGRTKSHSYIIAQIFLKSTASKDNKYIIDIHINFVLISKEVNNSLVKGARQIK